MAAVLYATGTLGCAMPYSGHFAALSTEPNPLFGYNLDDAPRVRNVEAEAVMHVILWVPTRTSTPTIQEVVSEALYRGNGDLLVDADVEHWSWYIPFVYGQQGWRVRGDVVRANRATPSGAAPTAEAEMSRSD
jgi:hypothetical protein